MLPNNRAPLPSAVHPTRHVAFQLTPEQEQATLAVLDLSNTTQPQTRAYHAVNHLSTVGHEPATTQGQGRPSYIHATAPAAAAPVATGNLTTPPRAAVYAYHPDAAVQGSAGFSSSANLVSNDSVVQHVVQLSDVPLGAVPDLPGGSNSVRDGHKAHSRHRSDGVSSVGGKSGTSGLSRVRQNIEDTAEELALHINHPKQVTSRSCTTGRTVLKWLGRVGWCGKAVVYAMIGGLACRSAMEHSAPPAVAQTSQVSASPQGAFVLLGTVPGGVDIPLLIVMLLALLAYIAWRFTEAVRGQGYDKTFSSKKNFFKFRVSPAVSGAVYCSYLVFILELLHTEVNPQPPGLAKESWPSTWRHTSAGKAGLVLLGLAFLIATCIQLQGVFTKQWHRDYREDIPSWARRAVFAIGHVGFAGRAGAFLAMAIFFLKDASGVGEEEAHNYSMVANALLQLQASRGLRAILMIVGILLVCYGLFAVLSSWARQFPTPAPTRQRVTPGKRLQESEELGGTLEGQTSWPQPDAGSEQQQQRDKHSVWHEV